MPNGRPSSTRSPYDRVKGRYHRASGTAADGTAADGTGKKRELTAVPYYAWSNRGPGDMAVWLTRTSN